MATGIARGLASAKDEPGAPEAMLFADAAPDRAQQVAEEVGGEALPSNREVADAADLVVLAVKPNVLDDVAPDLVEAGTPVISILAGTSLERLAEALPGIDLVRVMPNLGAQLRQAVLCVAFPDGLGEEARQRASGLLGLIGEVIELDEDLIDAATALMGCSPGYLALMAEVLVEEGVKEGLTEEQALSDGRALDGRDRRPAGAARPRCAEAGRRLARRHDRGRPCRARGARDPPGAGSRGRRLAGEGARLN